MEVILFECSVVGRVAARGQFGNPGNLCFPKLSCVLADAKALWHSVFKIVCMFIGRW
jgi:hypothetical protein